MEAISAMCIPNSDGIPISKSRWVNLLPGCTVCYFMFFIHKDREAYTISVAPEMRLARTLPGVELVAQSIIGSSSSMNEKASSRAPTVDPVQSVASRLAAKLGHPKSIAKPHPKPRMTNPPPHFPSSDSEPRDSDMEDDTSSSDSNTESDLRLAQVTEQSAAKLPVEKPAHVEKPKPPAPAVDEYANWDNGEPLTQEERQAILRLKSNYEKSREMNKRRNRRIQIELGLLDVDDIFKPKAKRTTDDTGTKSKRKKGGEPTRRSERTKTRCVDT